MNLKIFGKKVPKNGLFSNLKYKLNFVICPHD